MLQLCVCRDIEHLGSLERVAAPGATLTPLSCSPSFPLAQYLDIRTLTHELIVNLHSDVFTAFRSFPSYLDHYLIITLAYITSFCRKRHIREKFSCRKFANHIKLTKPTLL